MKGRYAIAGSAISAIFACGSVPAEAAALATSPTEAEAEVERLQAELEAAKSRARAARELEAARAEAQAAERRVAEAERQAGASAAGQNTTPTEALAEQVAEEIVTEQERRATQEFGGIEFGVGVSFTLDMGENDRVSSAEVVNGIVRVTDENNGRARIMLESHYFFKPKGHIFSAKEGMWGIGPFVALQPGTDDVIDAIAFGAMAGFRMDTTTTQSFNVGLGLVVDPNTRILGDGIVANEPLPVGETEVRYKEVMQTGILALVSFSF